MSIDKYDLKFFNRYIHSLKINGRAKSITEIANNCNIKGGQSRLSQVINGHVPLTEDFADNIYSFYPILDNSTNTVNEPSVQYRSAKPIDVDNDNTIHASLVSQYAQAGYLNGFHDPEYTDTLPKIAFTNGFQAKGNYLCFEVKGDSMDDGSYNSYLEGDILLCREINKEYWKSKLHINKWDFVIVHKDQGIIVKKISDHDVDNGIITIHSLNDFYPDEKLHLKDIMQIFNVVNFQRKGNKR